MRPRRPGPLAWLLRLAGVAAVAAAAAMLSRPPPALTVFTQGARLGVRVPPGDPAPPRAWLDDSLTVLTPAAEPGVWRSDRALTPGGQRVRVAVGDREFDLGEVRGPGPPLVLVGPAPGRRVAVRCLRPVTAWWAARPADRFDLEPGRHALPAPPRDAPAWRLEFRGAGGDESQEFDKARVLRRWLRQASRRPDAGQHRRVIGPPRDPADRAAPFPFDRFEGWEVDLFESAKGARELRAVWNRWRDAAHLAGLAGPAAAGDREPCPPPPDRLGWRPARRRREPRLKGAVALPKTPTQRDFAGLMNDLSMQSVLPPPGESLLLKKLQVPELRDLPPGPLVLVLPVRGAAAAWIRIWEVDVHGDGYRTPFPPGTCPGVPEEWLVWRIPRQAPPVPNFILLVEVFGDPAIRGALRVGEARLGVWDGG